jgi:hypothetical protein
MKRNFSEIEAIGVPVLLQEGENDVFVSPSYYDANMIVLLVIKERMG